nr:unnamed protein product [Spirometra erinaceieuropaei]
MSIRILPSENGNSGLLFVGFNQDYGCFAVGMQNGFRIYNTDPLKQLERCDFSVRDGTGVGYIEMLFRTSFLGLLGGGHQARMPPNTACLWDGVEQKSGRLLPRYFSSTSSQIRCTPETKFKTICAFSPRRSDTLIVLAADGSYYKYNYAPNGTVICEESINFLDVFEDENDL